MVYNFKKVIDASAKRELNFFYIPAWQLDILSTFCNYEQDGIQLKNNADFDIPIWKLDIWSTF